MMSKEDLIHGLPVSLGMKIPVKNITRLAVAWEQRREVARNVFGIQRTSELEAISRLRISQITTIGFLNAFEICLQIEGDHPGRTEEIIERAHKLVEDTENLVGGFLQALIQVLKTVRRFE